MATLTNSSIQTLTEVAAYMATFAGGVIPSEDDAEYLQWQRWIQVKQENYAKRAFWRRLLKREEITLSGTTTALPDDFHKPNGLYMLIVDGVDWQETPNEDEQNVFIEMDTDSDSASFGKWRMRFLNEVPADTAAIAWYFANPPKPEEGSDKLLLPGDMVAYAALIEYFRAANQEGSMDKAQEDAEGLFAEYLSSEVIPDKSELLTNSERRTGNRLTQARARYATRPNRYYQNYG